MVFVGGQSLLGADVPWACSKLFLIKKSAAEEGGAAVLKEAWLAVRQDRTARTSFVVRSRPLPCIRTNQFDSPRRPPLNARRHHHMVHWRKDITDDIKDDDVSSARLFWWRRLWRRSLAPRPITPCLARCLQSVDDRGLPSLLLELDLLPEMNRPISAREGSGPLGFELGCV